MSGGRNAIRGFLVQTLMVILDGLDRADWTTVVLEPDGVSEKVDVLWQGPVRRHVQVKSTASGVSVADVKRWAVELREACGGARPELHVCGPASAGAVAVEAHHGVRVVLVTSSIEDLFERCELRLHRTLHRQGCYGVEPDQLRPMVERLIGRLLAGSVRPVTWTRKELLTEVLELAQPPLKAAAPTEREWRQTRIVRVEATGETLETLVCGFRLVTGGRAQIPDQVHLRFTDAEADLAATPGEDLPVPRWEAGAVSGIYLVCFWPSGHTVPSGWSNFGATVRRRGLVSNRGGSLLFADRLLPVDGNDSPCESVTMVVMPEGWEASQSEGPPPVWRKGRVAVWRHRLAYTAFPEVRCAGTFTGASGDDRELSAAADEISHAYQSPAYHVSVGSRLVSPAGSPTWLGEWLGCLL